MRPFSLGRYVSSVSVSALLAGCGGSQPPIGAPGAMSQSRAAAGHAARGGSWMLPGASQGDLIYVLSAQRENGGQIIAYPSGDPVGYFGFPQSHFFSYGICSDSKGNVFATVGGVSYNFIDEFSHDGSLIATLIGDYNWPIGCAADPSTGNLAVVGYDIGIYRHARGSPHLYHDPVFRTYSACGYDNRGNLFVVGSQADGSFALAELPKGKHKFTNISLNKRPGNPSSVQWDGKNLAIEAQMLVSGKLGRYVVYRVQVSGSKRKSSAQPSLRIIGAPDARRYCTAHLLRFTALTLSVSDIGIIRQGGARTRSSKASLLHG